jgi:hypothetical protein
LGLVVACTDVPQGPTDAPEGFKPDFAIVLPSGGPVTLTNGLPSSDPDHFSAVLSAGGGSNTLNQDGSEVLFEMFGVLDLAALGTHRLDQSDPQGPVLLTSGLARTAANLVTGSGEVTVLMTSHVPRGKEYLVTAYEIVSDFDMSGSRFFEYVDLDILGPGNDAFSAFGSIGSNDLVMRQEDGGVAVDRVANSAVTGFAVDFFSGLRSAILGGGFDPPPGGDVAAVLGDLTNAFEFELSGPDANPSTGMGSTPGFGLTAAAMDVRSNVNLTSQGVIPVALLSDDDFDAMSVDLSTIAFGPGGAAPAHDPNEKDNLHGQDTDNDGDRDRMLHFRTQESGIRLGDTEACLTGTTTDGSPFFACAPVDVREAVRRGRSGGVGASAIDYAPELGPFVNPVALGDDRTSAALPIGFDFKFFGNTYTEFVICSNGFIGFGLPTEAGCPFTPSAIPQADSWNNLIAAAWVDLNPSAGGTISYETRGKRPHRRLVVSYENVPWWPSGPGTVTTQVILFEQSNDVEVHTDFQSAGRTYTQGVENADGTEAAFLEGRVLENFGLDDDAVRFTTGKKGKGN